MSFLVTAGGSSNHIRSCSSDILRYSQQYSMKRTSGNTRIIFINQSKLNFTHIWTFIIEKPSWLTFPFLLATLNAILGDMSSSRDSCSDNFFLRRSITLGPLVVLCRSTVRGLMYCSSTCLVPHFIGQWFIFRLWNKAIIVLVFLPYISSTHRLINHKLDVKFWHVFLVFCVGVFTSCVFTPFLFGSHSWSGIFWSSWHQSPHPGREGWGWTRSPRWSGRSDQPVGCTTYSRTVALFCWKTRCVFFVQ